MSREMALYGPDKSFAHDGAAHSILLGGNLSVLLPEDRYDRQPVQTPDKQFWLVADVRLDNRADLLRKLYLAPEEPIADSSLLALAWQRWLRLALAALLMPLPP